MSVCVISLFICFACAVFCGAIGNTPMTMICLAGVGVNTALIIAGGQ